MPSNAYLKAAISMDQSVIVIEFDCSPAKPSTDYTFLSPLATNSSLNDNLTVLHCRIQMDFNEKEASGGKNNEEGKKGKDDPGVALNPVKLSELTPLEQLSTPELAPKVCISSSVNVSRDESAMDSTASIKTDADSDIRLNQDHSGVQPSFCNHEKVLTESTAQMKRQMSDEVKIDFKEGALFPESPQCEPTEHVTKRTVSSVVQVKPGAPPPLKLEPGATLHIRQPFKILTDIWGVLTSYDFRNDLFDYLEANFKSYILTHFEEDDTKEYVQALAKRTADDLAKYPSMPPVLIPEENPNKETIASAVEENLAFRKASKDKSLMSGLEMIYNQIWNDGYKRKTLHPRGFADVLPNFRKWHAEPFFIKLFTFASGPPEIQKLFLSASDGGDIAEFVTYGFDTRNSFKYDCNRYRQVVSGLSEREPRNLFYLTDSPKKGRQARLAGLTVFIVRRPGNKSYKEEDLSKFTVIDSLDQFDFFEFK